jgi:hypothetical protein
VLTHPHLTRARRGVDTYVASTIVPGPFPPAPAPPAPPPPGPPGPPTPEPPLPNVPTIDDWHYPSEEADEAAVEAMLDLSVTSVVATSNSTGTVTVRCGSNASTATATSPGDVVFGWVLRGFLTGMASAGVHRPIALHVCCGGDDCVPLAAVASVIDRAFV